MRRLKIKQLTQQNYNDRVTKRLMDRLQSVLNAAARLVHNSRHHFCLRDLHWLRVPERIKFRLAVLVFRCRNQTAPNYLARDLQWADTDDSRRRLRSAITQKLLVRCTRLRTIGDRAFGAVAPRVIIIIIIIINDSIYPAVSMALRTGNKVSCQPNDCPNRRVFKRRLKMSSDGAETMSAGRIKKAAAKWNLPADIVSAPSLDIFKQRLKTRLFGQSFG